MNSAEVKDFQYAIQTFIESNTLPLEVKRLVIREIYEDLLKKADQEIYNQLLEREEKKDA